MANLTDPGFARFLAHARHTDPQILNLALRDGLVQGKWKLQDADGTVVHPSTLNLSTLRITLPEGELTSESEAEIYVESKSGQVIRTVVSPDGEELENPTPPPPLRQELVNILAKLTVQEARVLSLRFGLDTGEPRELQTVADIMDLPATRIRQIETQAMAKLTHDDHETIAASAASVKVREELAELIQSVDDLPASEQADLLIDIVANAIQKGRAEHQAIREAIIAERDEEFWEIVHAMALERLGLDNDEEALTGKELEEFERHWQSGMYQKALRHQIATGGLRLTDTATGQPADIEPDTLTFERDGQRVLIRADGRRLRVDSETAMPTGDVVRRTLSGPPGMRGYIWFGKLPGTPRRCPRCGVCMIPTDEHPGEYPGAMSRVRVGGSKPGYASRSVEICSPCGQDEAMGRGQAPIEEWPIGTDGITFYDRSHREDVNARFAALEEQE